MTDVAMKPVRSRLLYVWVVLGVVFIVLGAVTNGLAARYMFLAPSSSGDIGARLVRTTGIGTQHVVVTGMTPESPLAAQGIRNGDELVLAQPWDDLRKPMAGERFAFQRLTGGKAVSMSVTLPPSPANAPDSNLTANLSLWSNLAMLVVGALILWRNGGDPGIVALSLALLASGVASPSKWPVSSESYLFWHLVAWSGFATVAWCFLYFAMGYYERHTRAIARGARLAFWSLAALQLLVFAVNAFETLQNEVFRADVLIKCANFGLQALAMLATVYFVVRGLMQSEPDIRRRYILIFASLAMIQFGYILFAWQSTFTFFHYQHDSVTIIGGNMGAVIGSILVAYAVFRNRVLDLGFAVNRTLVYGVVSVILLLAFGLIEWASEKFIPIESREKNLVIDAAIAVGIFLTFHRVRDFVEHHIEALFFHKWHANEARLRKFVTEAGFFGKPEALTHAFFDEIERFSGGAACGLYGLREGSGYLRLEGAMLETIDGDDLALVAMRAHRGAVEIADTRSPLPAALALPMMQRAELSGFVLMGAKPSGDSYRPDEREVLAWAAHQIGLDLHALDIEQLQKDKSQLEIRYNELSAYVRPAGKPART